MTPAQVRALAYGAQLAEVNRQLATREDMAATATNRGKPLALWLMGTARLRAARRQLRAALFDALLECPGLHERPGFDPMSNNSRDWAGRHAAR